MASSFSAFLKERYASLPDFRIVENQDGSGYMSYTTTQRSALDPEEEERWTNVVAAHAAERLRERRVLCCRACGEPNPYQTEEFTCFSCRGQNA